MITNNEQLRELQARIEARTDYGNYSAKLVAELKQALTYAMGEINQANTVISNLISRSQGYELQISKLTDELSRIKNIGVEDLGKHLNKHFVNNDSCYTFARNEGANDITLDGIFNCNDIAQAVLDFINNKGG